MNILKASIAVSCLLAPPAFAGEYTGIVRPYYYSNGLYLDPGSSTATSRPACATRTLLKLEEGDANDPIYKNKFSILLASYMAQKKVYLGGRGTCTAEGDEVIYIVSPLAN